MRNRSAPWNRTCPECNTTFASVQSTGVCPCCGLIFVVDENSQVLQRIRHVGDPTPPPPTAEELAVRSIAKYLRLLNREIITIADFCYNVILAFAYMPETCWHAAADAIPPDLAVNIRSYLDTYLPGVDFMPSPRPFMTDTRSETAVEQKKHELRPKYVALYQFWKSRG